MRVNQFDNIFVISIIERILDIGEERNLKNICLSKLLPKKL